MGSAVRIAAPRATCLRGCTACLGMLMQAALPLAAHVPGPCLLRTTHRARLQGVENMVSINKAILGQPVDALKAVVDYAQRQGATGAARLPALLWPGGGGGVAAAAPARVRPRLLRVSTLLR